MEAHWPVGIFRVVGPSGRSLATEYSNKENENGDPHPEDQPREEPARLSPRFLDRPPDLKCRPSEMNSALTAPKGVHIVVSHVVS
jgi:hypothetical protein